MTMIVYGNPVSEAAPVLNYRKNYPNGGGLVTIDAELTREITASTLYIKNLVETAQRLTLADELTAAGQSYGHGWTLRDSATIDSADGFETVLLRYLKPNVSPLEYGNPAALSIALTATQGIVKWHGAPAIVYESDKALEGFQLVAGGSGALMAFVLPSAYVGGSERVKIFVGREDIPNGYINYYRWGISYSDNAYVYTTGAGQYKDVRGKAFDLTLGGKTVARAIDPPKILRYGYSATPGYGSWGAPRRIYKWIGGRYDTEQLARAAALAYYTDEFKPTIVAQAAAAKALQESGQIVLGYTAVADGDNDGIIVESTLDYPDGTHMYGFAVWMKATENYILESDLKTQNFIANPDAAARYNSIFIDLPQYASPAWTLDADSATCRVGGGVLLTVPPDESDSGSASA